MSDFARGAARLAGLAGALAGWRPEEFWRATPSELETVVTALTGGEGEARPVDAGELARLREMFPDG